MGFDKNINWQHLFDPGSVALIGASNSPGSWGLGIMRHLLLASGKRKIYPVNPTAPEVQGVPTYKSVIDIPGPVDLAVVAVSAPQVPAVFRQCAQKGIKAAVTISGGFAETGEQGRKLEAEVVNIARETGIHFIGPNSMGHTDTLSRLSTLAWTEEVTPGPVALISQSGNFGHQILRNGMNSDIGFSKFISSGNEASLHLEDYVEYLAQDKDTKVIAAYIEGLREGRRFFELARQITPRKPIVVIKAGGTRRSAEAARSHTGALAGSEAVYAAAFKQSGVIRVEDDDELCDVIMALLYPPLPRGNRIGILTNWGGLGVVAAEACEKEGHEIVPLAASTVAKMNALLPPRWSHSNPIDMGGISLDETVPILSSLWALMEDPGVDSVILQVPVPLGADRVAKNFSLNAEQVEALKEKEENAVKMIREKINEHGKPVFSIRRSYEFAFDRDTFSLLHKYGIPAYPTPRRAAKVLHHLNWYRRFVEAARASSCC